LAGGKRELNTVTAKFSIEEVERIAAKDKKGTFYIKVVGPRDKKWKIQKKHWKKLP
jgi:hypothetical protein